MNIYYQNKKGYYSCFKCKNHVKEKTSLEKYGTKSYSNTVYKNLQKTGNVAFIS